MGASFSLAKAKSKVRRYEEQVQNFTGSYSSEDFRKLKSKLSNINLKILQLPINVKETQECKDVILRIGKCFQDLKDKAHAASMQNLQSSQYLNIRGNNEGEIAPPPLKPKRDRSPNKHKKEYPPLPDPSSLNIEASYTKPRRDRSASRHKKEYPPLPDPSSSNIEASYTNPRRDTSASRHRKEYPPLPDPTPSNIGTSYTNPIIKYYKTPPVPKPIAPNGETSYKKNTNKYEKMVPPIPKPNHSELGFDKFTHIYPPLPIGEVFPDTLRNEQPKNVLPPVPLDLNSNLNKSEIMGDQEQPKTILPPVPLDSSNFDESGVVDDAILPPVPLDSSNFDESGVVDDAAIGSDTAAKRIFPPVPLNSQLKIFPPVVKA